MRVLYTCEENATVALVPGHEVDRLNDFLYHWGDREIGR